MAETPASDNLFVSNLPETITQELLESVLQGYGTVTSSRVLPSKFPGSKASALVRFGSVAEAQWIVDNLNGNLAAGLDEPLIVRFANAPGAGGKGAPTWGGASEAGKGGGGGDPTPSDNVFVTELPADITTELFQQVMSQYGTVNTCRVMPPKMPGYKASGLVRFASVEEATWVVQSLNGNLAEGLPEPLTVRFANAPGSKGGGAWAAAGPYGGKGAAKAGGKGGKSSQLYGAMRKAGVLGSTERVPDECQVFIRGLPADTMDLDLFKMFSPFGAIAPNGVKAMVTETGACKGIGFVDYRDVSVAAEAVNALNGFAMPDGSFLSVSLKKPGSGKGAQGKSQGEYQGEF